MSLSQQVQQLRLDEEEEETVSYPTEEDLMQKMRLREEEETVSYHSEEEEDEQEKEEDPHAELMQQMPPLCQELYSGARRQWRLEREVETLRRENAQLLVLLRKRARDSDLIEDLLGLTAVKRRCC